MQAKDYTDFFPEEEVNALVRYLRLRAVTAHVVNQTMATELWALCGKDPGRVTVQMPETHTAAGTPMAVASTSAFTPGSLKQQLSLEGPAVQGSVPHVGCRSFHREIWTLPLTADTGWCRSHGAVLG